MSFHILTLFIPFRFLKSDLYKDSLLADMAANPLPINGRDNVDPQLAVDMTSAAATQLNTSAEGGGAGGGKSSKEK